jgi:hypothetical protein
VDRKLKPQLKHAEQGTFIYCAKQLEYNLMKCWWNDIRWLEFFCNKDGMIFMGWNSLVTRVE